MPAQALSLVEVRADQEATGQQQHERNQQHATHPTSIAGGLGAAASPTLGPGRPAYQPRRSTSQLSTT